MTLLEIEKAAAALLSDGDLAVTTADFTVGGFDLGLSLLNQIRRQAELLHDFNFNRKLVTVTVNSITGGSLDSAVLYGTATAADIKTIINVGQFDTNGNLIPVDWGTTESSLSRQIEDNPWGGGIRYPTDGQVAAYPNGRRRFTITNNAIYFWPKTETSENLTIGLEAYIFQVDWAATTETDVWTTKGSAYLMYSLIVQLNNRFKFYVPRTEGNLAPPQTLANEALASLLAWDIFKYNQFRRDRR